MAIERSVLFKRKASEEELGIFALQLQVLLGAGMPIIEALKLLGEDASNRDFGNAIRRVARKVCQGESLSAAMEINAYHFPETFRYMIASGEAAGNLERILKNLGIYYRGQAKQKKEVQNAVRYPVVVAVISMAVLIFLVTYVIPIFANTFEVMEAELPRPTQVLLVISETIGQYWLLMLLIAVLVILFIKAMGKNRGIRLRSDYRLLKIPYLGNLLLWFDYKRVADVLLILQGSGVEMLRALDITQKVLHNTYIQKKLMVVKESVQNGNRFADSLEETGIFQHSFYQMVRVGEKSGKLELILEEISLFYDNKIRQRMDAFVALLEPAVLCCVGAAVFYIVLCMMLPIFELYEIYSSTI